MLKKIKLADSDFFKLLRTNFKVFINPIRFISRSSLKDSRDKLLKGLRFILPGRYINPCSFSGTAVPEKLHGFIYLPGSINLRPFRSLSLESFREDLEINLIGLIKTLKFVLNNLKKSESASLIFFSTVAVQKGMAFHSSVAASKGAIEGLSKSLASELSPNIRVNVIAPSLVDTPLANRFLNNEQKKQKASEKHPLKKIGNPADIGEMIEFLISEKSSWITGQIIGVDGGLSTLDNN